MANWANPTLSSTYTNFVSEVNGRDTDVALGMDPAFVTVTNPPTNAIRWSSAASKWQKWSGTAWNDLASSYAINVAGTLTAPLGAVATPSITFSGAATTGFYAPSAGTVALSMAGTQRLYVTSAGRFSFGAGTSPVAPVTVSGGGFAVQETAVNRGLSFTDAAGTVYGSFGYNSAAGALDAFVSNAQSGGRVILKIASTDRVILSETAMTMAVPLVMSAGQQLRVGDGSVTAPSIAHTEGSNDTGIYFPGDGFINFASNGLLRFGIDDNGRIFGTALHNNAVVPTGTTNQYIASGTYTPTFAALTGVSSATVLSGSVFKWIRVGNVVMVSGAVDAIYTSTAAGNKAITMTIPIPVIGAGFATTGDASGTISSFNGPGDIIRAGGVSGYNGVQSVTCTWYTLANTNSLNWFSVYFLYEIK